MSTTSARKELVTVTNAASRRTEGFMANNICPGLVAEAYPGRTAGSADAPNASRDAPPGRKGADVAPGDAAGATTVACCPQPYLTASIAVTTSAPAAFSAMNLTAPPT